MEFGLLRGLTTYHGQVRWERKIRARKNVFTYRRMWNVDYEDSETKNLILDVQTTACKRRVVVDENNLVVDY